MGILSKASLKTIITKMKNDKKLNEICKTYHVTKEEAIADFIEDLEWSTFHTYEELENLNILQLRHAISNSIDISNFRHASKVSIEYKGYVKNRLAPYLDDNGELIVEKVNDLLEQKKEDILQQEMCAPFVVINGNRKNKGLNEYSEEEFYKANVIEIPELTALYGNCQRLFVDQELKTIVPCFISTTIEYNEPGAFLKSLEGPSFDERYFIENKKLTDMVMKEIKKILDKRHVVMGDTYDYYKKYFLGDNEENGRLMALLRSINYLSENLELQFKRSLPTEYSYLEEYSVEPVEQCINLITGNRETFVMARKNTLKKLIKYGYDDIVEEIKCMNQ
ncbi:hypothetical protein R2F61_03880 [Mollicutes bacterium LVI A0078]|nr:hypothetical protein RZE84_03905 [Mollicutes bacterium LVI A0075]WOO91702.1 hypothetical protein R2F61_03880 [Mollicutes bacterium LVI A0078]